MTGSVYANGGKVAPARKSGPTWFGRDFCPACGVSRADPGHQALEWGVLQAAEAGYGGAF
jgi:hypothetical protein